MLTLIRREPVMTATVVLAAVLAALIVLGYLTLGNVSDFVDVFGNVLLILGPVVLGGFVRSKVTPVATDV